MNMEPFQTNIWKISFPFQRRWFSGLIPLPRRSRREGTLARAWKSGPKVLFPCRFLGEVAWCEGQFLTIRKYQHHRGDFLESWGNDWCMIQMLIVGHVNPVTHWLRGVHGAEFLPTVISHTFPDFRDSWVGGSNLNLMFLPSRLTRRDFFSFKLP